MRKISSCFAVAAAIFIGGAVGASPAYAVTSSLSTTTTTTCASYTAQVTAAQAKYTAAKLSYDQQLTAAHLDPTKYPFPPAPTYLSCQALGLT